MSIKKLGVLDVYALAAGAMISSGIFILPGVAYLLAGPALPLSYMIAGVLALFGVFHILELSTALPRAGGDYFYVQRTFGPFVGSITGLLSWFALGLKSSLALFGLSEVIHLITGWPLVPVALVACGFFVLLNLTGAHGAARVETVLVLVLLAIMATFSVFGVLGGDRSRFLAPIPSGITGILSATGFVFVSFGGLMNIANVSEEVRHPKRALPLGMLLAVSTVTLLYGVVVSAIIGALDPAVLTGSLTPAADAARSLTGRPGFLVMTAASILAFITTANAGILAASRFPLAMARDRLLPSLFSFQDRRRGTPIPAIVLTGLLVAGSLFLDLESLAKTASSVVLTSNIMAALSVIIMRESGLKHYRPSFKVPLYPWLPLASIGAFLVVLYDLGLSGIRGALVFAGLGVLLYFIYGRRHSKGEFALLYLLKRIMDHRMPQDHLEQEFRKIVAHRDRSDRDWASLVARAEFLDISGTISREELFDEIANAIGKVLGSDRRSTRDLLEERERQSRTYLGDGIAIPHIIVPGKGLMEMVIVRSREGIDWYTGESGSEDSAKAVFCLLGSPDVRDDHVVALAAIARAAYQPWFLEHWTAAADETRLKDLLREMEAGENPATT